MKKLNITVSTLLALTMGPIAFASGGDTSGGCGLGWKVNNRMSLSGTSTRGTTNSTFGGVFGTTSGTSGCDQFSIVRKDKRAIHYVEANYDSLIRESATGRGETIEGLASTLNCDPRSFGNALRANYINLLDRESPAQFLLQVQQMTESSPVQMGCAMMSQI